MSQPLLEARSITRVYRGSGSLLGRGGEHVTAVRGASLRVESGETLGLVGESGCGKSTLARLLLRLERPTDGTALWRGCDLWELSRAEVRRFRRSVQVVFQDPYGSLNPKLTVRSALREVLRFHRLASGPAIAERVGELLGLVGLDPDAADRYPHEFSGGQRQRIGLARALSVEPEMLVADEPVSALDVSVQAHVLGLLQDLKSRFGFTLLFVSHDLAVVRQVSDRVAVMKDGSIVEDADAESVFRHPRHDYTRRLLEAVPRIGEPASKGPPATA